MSGVRSIIGRIGRERGINHEVQVLEALNRERQLWPAWFQGAERANRAQDRKGIDLIVRSDVGKLFIQVKSSRAGKKKFEERRHRLPIEVIIVQTGYSDERICQNIFVAASQLRDQFLAKRNPGAL